MKRFVVFCPDAGKEDESAFIRSLGAAQWWHRLVGAWLIVDESAQLSSVSLRDAIKGINSDLDCMVVEVGVPVSFASRLDNDESEKTAEWVSEHWHTGPLRNDYTLTPDR